MKYAHYSQQNTGKCKSQKYLYNVLVIDSTNQELLHSIIMTNCIPQLSLVAMETKAVHIDFYVEEE